MYLLPKHLTCMIFKFSYELYNCCFSSLYVRFHNDGPIYIRGKKNCSNLGGCCKSMPLRKFRYKSDTRGFLTRCRTTAFSAHYSCISWPNISWQTNRSGWTIALAPTITRLETLWFLVVGNGKEACVHQENWHQCPEGSNTRSDIHSSWKCVYKLYLLVLMGFYVLNMMAKLRPKCTLEMMGTFI